MTPIVISLRKSEVDFIRKLAKSAEIGGKSNVRSDNDRQSTLSEDQLIGMLAEAAGHKYWYGHLLEFARSRWFRNQMPSTGDGGMDISPLNVDIKGSMIRNPIKDFDEYNLLVRPLERHEDWVYIPALVNIKDNGDALVYLMGWATDNMLPQATESEGIFKGAYRLPFRQLKELIPIKTYWVSRDS